ncbi:MAG: Maf family protein [Xanthomonadales bacterium]|nr:Maf family protein [Xanthomonadales bacterium]
MATPDSTAADFILGSSSPRRRELLRQVGARFRVVVAEVDESVHEGELPADYVLRVARDKSLAVLRAEPSTLPVLAADTTVVLDGAILGKPADPEEAAAMLVRLSGRTHEVYSAVVLARRSGPIHDRLNVTRVTFAPLDAAWIDAYIATGDPLDKAGSYGVQGRAAEKIVRVEGSFSGVMGLPLYETCELLRYGKVLSYRQ